MGDVCTAVVDIRRLGCWGGLPIHSFGRRAVLRNFTTSCHGKAGQIEAGDCHSLLHTLFGRNVEVLPGEGCVEAAGHPISASIPKLSSAVGFRLKIHRPGCAEGIEEAISKSFRLGPYDLHV